MRKRAFIYYLIILFFSNILTGCAPLIIGAAVGGIGGYAISKDTIQGDTDKAYSVVWGAVLRVAKIRGTIKEEDSARGYMELTAEASRVWIRVIKINETTTRLKVSARRHHLPNLDLAQDIFVKIREEAK